MRGREGEGERDAPRVHRELRNCSTVVRMQRAGHNTAYLRRGGPPPPPIASASDYRLRGLRRLRLVSPAVAEAIGGGGDRGTRTSRAATTETKTFRQCAERVPRVFFTLKGTNFSKVRFPGHF